MNYLVLSKIYSLTECKCTNDCTCENECEESTIDFIKVKNYEDLENKLLEFNIDFVQGNIVIDVKYKSNIEEILATPDNLIFTNDESEVSYEDVTFIIRHYCLKKSVILVKDDKKYCIECFKKKNQIPFEKIKEILSSEDETYGLSTSQKIEYILIKNKGKKLSAAEIYDIGYPWDLKTFTPRQSVYARTSSLFKKGSIKRDGMLYYI